jgi:serine protease Do
MKTQHFLAATIFLGTTLGLCTPIQASGSRNDRRTPVVEVCEKVRGAVVNIHSERAIHTSTDDAFGASPQRNASGMGTGIVIDARGYIVTNQHVIDNVDTIRVHLSDGTIHVARVIARDAETDLALIKIDAGRPLPTLTLGTSSDLMVGESVIAIGNAFGYENSATTGIISYKGRDVSLNKEVSYKSLIQTNAAINPGNSGGPLLNIHGELIGVNVAIRAGAQGISFAIPVDTMLRVTAEMLHRRNGYSLGLAARDQVGEPEPEIVSTRGPARDKGLLLPGVAGNNGSARWLMVERVDAASNAQRSGLEAGDVITQVGGQNVTCNLDLERALLDKRAGETVPVVVRRKDAEKRLVLALDRSSLPPLEVIWKKIGIRLQHVNPDFVARNDPTHTLHGGMIVTEVEKTGPAGRVGVARGDILVGLNGYETISLENVAYVLNYTDQEKVRIDREKSRIELESQRADAEKLRLQQDKPRTEQEKARSLQFIVIRDGRLLQGAMETDVRSGE